MIQTKYNTSISTESIQNYCDPYLVNRIFKIMCLQEENKDWKTYVINLNHELLGADNIYLNNVNFLALVHKIESLLLIDNHEDFRRMIFESISIAKSIPKNIKIIK
jgi:hypothetical protein